MSTRLARILALLALCTLLAACATHEKPLAPALFPSQTPAPTLDATAMSLELVDPDQQYRSHGLNSPEQIQMPIGRIVEAAGRLALAAEFAPLADSEGANPRTLRLRVDSVTADADDRLVYFVPLGPLSFGRTDVTTRLAFRVNLVGPGDTVRWSQSYDSGKELLEPQRKGLFLELITDGIQRQTHEQAARLMRQAARDLRAWLEQERRRERVM
jgi:hypothetical protein